MNDITKEFVASILFTTRTKRLIIHVKFIPYGMLTCKLKYSSTIVLISLSLIFIDVYSENHLKEIEMVLF